ncbi:MAG: hypothetical protein ACOYL6_03290 [Bacteriovoracaceae bacterium]
MKEKKEAGGQFSLLTETERTPRLNDLCRLSETIVVWLKGSPEKFTFKAYGFNKDHMLMELVLTDSKNPEILFNQKILGNSSSKSLQFFFSGKFTYDKVNKVYLLKLSENVYKFERRKNFRLQTSINHQVKITLNLPEEFIPPTNVVKFDSRSEQTKLFKSFMSIINQVSSDNETSYKVNFKIQDISISGISFIVGEIERKFIIEKNIFLNSSLVFNTKEYEIPKIKIVYVMDYLDPSKPGTRLFKVGLQFVDLPQEIDNELSMQISKELRDSDINKIFEDFLK